MSIQGLSQAFGRPASPVTAPARNMAIHLIHNADNTCPTADARLPSPGPAMCPHLLPPVGQVEFAALASHCRYSTLRARATNARPKFYQPHSPQR
ncbi:hypothetical protein BN873_70007 [Candidatus Competibacter denitrificans Run_A_D11]|uniref:Uncharacterized protein n=1 Tax=Candidatus Competibacter denitrificans Run_A_D11 TaxID=1400863 RepID=W6MAQ6_9GAMM|nr:hypothetical protein BN873_70007 [Candidatus Competibacter denitrificans Run_A_D11]